MRIPRGYLELLRPANVATALADVLAGWAVAGLANAWALPWLLCSTACLYAGGIVLNDVFDRRIDAVERPERPIPSGRVPVRRAAWLGAGLLAGGILAACAAGPLPAAVAGAIAAAVLVYDAGGKRLAVFGPINMGACRGLNLILGMAAAPAAVAIWWPLALLPTTYIAAVTALSRGEVHGGKRGIATFALVLLAVVIIALLALTLAPGRQSPAGLLLALFLGWRVLPPFWRARINPQPATIGHAIKTGVLSLVLVDAVLGATFAGALYSVTIVAAALVAGRLARVFSVT